MKLLWILVSSIMVLYGRKLPRNEDYDGEESNYGKIHDSVTKYKESIGSTSETSAEDDIFYFFSLHDYNKDHHLDGHELRLAYLGYELYEQESVEHSLTLEDLSAMVDHALLEDDKDNDGKISWDEYLESQKYHHNLK
ncbi:hypothetical protein BC833DRAFT_613009 [Globomyces pollinis-pini]|nr:hypothetical protein BC833DRAFT_613009 [Globomyces pollinis-pini]